MQQKTADTSGSHKCHLVLLHLYCMPDSEEICTDAMSTFSNSRVTVLYQVAQRYAMQALILLPLPLLSVMASTTMPHI